MSDWEKSELRKNLKYYAKHDWEGTYMLCELFQQAVDALDQADRERDAARELASEAIDEVEQWGNYAPEWAKQKWDFRATLDDLRGRLNAADAARTTNKTV
jgi:hypothetical protein